MRFYIVDSFLKGPAVDIGAHLGIYFPCDECFIDFLICVVVSLYIMPIFWCVISFLVEAKASLLALHCNYFSFLFKKLRHENMQFFCHFGISYSRVFFIDVNLNRFPHITGAMMYPVNGQGELLFRLSRCAGINGCLFVSI